MKYLLLLYVIIFTKGSENMIRKVEGKDYNSVKKLVLQVHKLHVENRPDIYLDNEPMPLEYFNEIITDDNLNMFVYEEDERILGLLEMSIKNNKANPIAQKRKTIFIEDIVVDVDNRKKGIGKKLYQYAVEIAKQEEADAIELNVWSFNESAIKFYESLGMTAKNIKLESLLNSSCDIKNISINVTSKTSK